MAIFAKWADVGFPTNIDTICNGLSHNHWTMFATLCEVDRGFVAALVVTAVSLLRQPTVHGDVAASEEPAEGAQ